MKTIKFIGYLFYTYYSTGSRAGIRYFSAIMSMTLLGFLHLLQIALAVHKLEQIPIKLDDGIIPLRVTLFLTGLPIYILMTHLFKKADIELLEEKYGYNWNKIHSGYIWLLFYIIASFIITVALAYWIKK